MANTTSASQSRGVDLARSFNQFLRKEEISRRIRSIARPLELLEKRTPQHKERQEESATFETSRWMESADTTTTESILYGETPGSKEVPTGEMDKILRRSASNRSLERGEDVCCLPPKRSRARGPTHAERASQTHGMEFRREPVQKAGKLRYPDDFPPRQPGSSRPDPEGRKFEPRGSSVDNHEVMIKQPETRPISQEQLVAEVKGIYAGLVMVDSKCIEVDNAQSSSTPGLRDEQWLALIAFHRTLLHDHDFSLASQHPSSSPALRRLARQYANRNSNRRPRRSVQENARFSSGLTDYVVEGNVNGVGTAALPDTGSDECIISSKFASELGLQPVYGTEKTITLANKKVVRSPGMVEVLWDFANENMPHSMKCWILPHCSNDIVLGNKFLQATETLTTFFHRVNKHFTPGIFPLRLIGADKQRLRGTLNGLPTAALADTGSDIMLISANYARLHGFLVSSRKQDRVEIELADGTRTWTSGIVRDMMWTIGEMTVCCDFHVLEDLSVPVVLSKNYVFELEVFSKYAGYFFNIDSLEDDSLLCGVRLIVEEVYDLSALESERMGDVLSLNAFSPEMVKRERVRRDMARDRIDKLPVAERSAATALEQAKRQEWDEARRKHKERWSRKQPPPVSGTTGNNGWSSTSGTASVASKPTGVVQSDANPSPWARGTAL